MNIRLLATKFHIPPSRSVGITRPRLLEQISSGLHENHKLTLVSAPAGYGKTTLVAEWFHSLKNEKLGVAWLSLDEADNDLARFLSYWLAAFQLVNESFSEKIQPFLNLPQFPPVKTLLDELLNELAVLKTPTLIGIEDYHIITNPLIHEALEYFIDHQPAGVHLILTTREDPLLPLSRLRARGQMTEIRARDLRFTPQEARQFFDLSLNLSLSDETLRALDERTEGWAAGLHLAALALQNQPDPAAFIETFRGSHRYVLDYLAEEVIRQQDEEIQQFLAQTCILEQFDAAACESLTGRADSQSMLHRLDQANLFIIPLDNTREWYRYHHLFADYLRTGLTRFESSALNQKAALYHEANDMIFEAVHYAQASSDHDFVADLVERAVSREAAWSSGRVSALTGWLAALPDAALKTRPLLSLHASRIAYLGAHFEQADTLIDQAEGAIAARSISGPEGDHLLALAALYRGGIASVRGDVRSVFEQTRHALAAIPPEEHLAQARATFSLALAYELSGETQQAVQTYLEASRLANEVGVSFLMLNARCAAALVQIRQGKLGMAAQTCHEALKLVDSKHIPPVGLVWAILGGIACEKDDLSTAERYIQDALHLTRQGGLMDDLNVGLIYQSRLLHAKGDFPGALSLLEQAAAVMDAFHVPRLSMLAAAYIARLRLAGGQIELAVQWAQQYQQVRLSQPVEYLREFEDLTLARIWLATGDLEAAFSLLKPLLEQAKIAGRGQVCIETHILLAQVHRARRNTPFAVENLSHALRIAAPEGYVRIFMDEGAALAELLPKARLAAPDLVDRLLDKKAHVKEVLSPLARLPEPLSEQEIRVLKLLMAGNSNREIADDLVISVGTAKWHVHNVLQKLGVSNRSQAIARAHELGIE
jgi:LuxR family transcriptional regulator, maltose regulon positive regulatory protein